MCDDGGILTFLVAFVLGILFGIVMYTGVQGDDNENDDFY